MSDSDAQRAQRAQRASDRQVEVDDIERRQTRLFALVALATTVGFLFAAGVAALLLKGQNDHEAQRRVQDRIEAARQREAAAAALEGKALLEEVRAATVAAQGALDAIKDCTTAGGVCKKQGEAATARAIDQIVGRINTALARIEGVSAQNAQLQRQVTQLAAEAAALRALLEQQRTNPQAPPATPQTPALCQIIRC